MTHVIIDRTLNGKKSSGNRQKFVRRVKKQVSEQVRKSIADGNIDDLVAGKGKKIIIPKRDLGQPTFRHGKGGHHERVFPGNKHFQQGDRIDRPQEGNGKGGKKGSKDGEGIDDFEFHLTQKEYLDFFFKDCELPNLRQTTINKTEIYEIKRSGFSVDGSAAQLNIPRTMKQAKGRRIGLHRRTKKKKLRELEQIEAILVIQIADLESQHKDVTKEKEKLEEIRKQIKATKRKLKAVPFVDDSDLRYNRWERVPVPTVQAVMFCVDGETEFLSPIGWKKISEYDNELVAQYNENGLMEFVQPLAYINNNYNGEFLKIQAQGIDQMLTPEHRVVYKNQTGKLKITTAREFTEKHNRTKFGSKHKFITHFSFDGKGLNLSEDEIKLHIAFKADGTYQQLNTNRAQFWFEKSRKINRLIEILNNLGISYNRTDREKGSWIYFTTPDRISKRYGPEWFNASTKQLTTISEEILLWDGHKGEKNTYTSKNKNDVDYIQFVWAATGFGTNVFYSSHVWVVYRSSFSERSLTSSTGNKIQTTVSSTKKSYCFNVPSGMLVLRRNDNIFITGNCVMDVSGSMGQWQKEMAKRYYMLLYLFLKREYERVDVIFIRHHTVAKEVDEEEFFYSKETGGTVVSSAFNLMVNVIKERYSPNEWNIYCSQASDGDNWSGDTHVCVEILENKVLPQLQYFTYIELNESKDYKSDIWPDYEILSKKYKTFQIRKVHNASEIYPVFKQLFKKQ